MHNFCILFFFAFAIPYGSSLALNKTEKFFISPPVLPVGSRSCLPSPPFASWFGAEEVGFDICLFNSTGNLVTNTMSAVGNTLWFIQNFGAYFLGSCHCRQDCTPSQIVCKNAGLIDAFLPEEFQFNINNGIAQLVYLTEMWNFYCYCPALIENGADPCIRPPHPELCEP